MINPRVFPHLRYAANQRSAREAVREPSVQRSPRSPVAAPDARYGAMAAGLRDILFIEDDRNAAPAVGGCPPGYVTTKESHHVPAVGHWSDTGSTNPSVEGHGAGAVWIIDYKEGYVPDCKKDPCGDGFVYNKETDSCIVSGGSAGWDTTPKASPTAPALSSQPVGRHVEHAPRATRAPVPPVQVAPSIAHAAPVAPVAPMNLMVGRVPPKIR